MKYPIQTEIQKLWQIAWPVLIGQIATVGMAASDVAMTGHLSKTDLASVALGVSLWSIFLVTVMGIMVAINAVISHELGAGREEQVPHIMRQSMWMALFVGLIICGLLNASTIVFDYLEVNTVINAKATQFIRVISVGMPALAMYRALYSYTTSLHETRPVMFIALAGLGFNIVMNYLFIYGHFGMPQLGSTGCALATGVGMWLMLFAMLWWIRRSPTYQKTDPFTHFEGPHFKEIGRMLRVGIPIGISYFVEVSAFCAVGLLVARFGDAEIAANQIALNFSSIVFMIPMSLGIALTTRVSHTLGEGDMAHARFVAWTGVWFAVGIAVFSAIFMVFAKDIVPHAYTNDVSVQKIAASILLLAAIFQLSDAAQVTMSCALRGYKVTSLPMLFHIIAFYVIALPIGIGLGLAPQWMQGLPLIPAQPMAAKGFWIALVIGLTVAALLLGVLLHKVSQHYNPKEPHDSSGLSEPLAEKSMLL